MRIEKIICIFVYKKYCNFWRNISLTFALTIKLFFSIKCENISINFKCNKIWTNFSLFFRSNGPLIMKQSWLQVELTEGYMFGIFPKLERNKVLKMPKTDPLNSFLFMEDTLLKFLTFLGTPMTHGLFALSLRIISCRFGKWLKIFTMMKKLILLPLKLKLHNNFINIWHFRSLKSRQFIFTEFLPYLFSQ